MVLLMGGGGEKTAVVAAAAAAPGMRMTRASVRRMSHVEKCNGNGSGHDNDDDNGNGNGNGNYNDGEWDEKMNAGSGSSSKRNTARNASQDTTTSSKHSNHLKTRGPLLLRRSSFHELVASSVTGHYELMSTGDITIRHEYFSPLIFVSCIAYGLVGVVYAAAGWWKMTIFFTCVTFFSVQADSLQPHSRFYNWADRVCASIGLLVCPVRVTIFNPCSYELRAAVWLLFALCFAALTWSRQSINNDQFVVRHSLWHLISIAGLAWLAWRETNNALLEPVVKRWMQGYL